MGKSSKKARNRVSCEICTISGSMLDEHHIIPRTDPRSTNLNSNLAVICANCHRCVHAGEIIIEGIYATSAGAKLFWHKNGDPVIVRVGVILLKDGTADIRG